MKIIIIDKDIGTISITLESGHEMRALYILLHLIAQKEFKAIRKGAVTFNDIPGLGEFCKEDIYQNPIKRLLMLMTGDEGKKPTATQLATIILACKSAINSFNHRLIKFLELPLMRAQSEKKLPHTLLLKATSLRRPLTEEEFMEDDYILQQSKLRHESMKDLYEEYLDYQDLIASFSSIDVARTANVIGLIDTFRQLSQTIAEDEYMQNDDVKVDGITINWNEHHVRPLIAGGMVGIGTGVTFVILKSIYDVVWGSIVEGDNKVLHYAIDNGVTILSAITAYSLNRYAFGRKSDYDHKLMVNAVKDVANKFPEYRRLLEEKGFLYSKNEITYLNSNQYDLVLDEDEDPSRLLLPM